MPKRLSGLLHRAQQLVVLQHIRNIVLVVENDIFPWQDVDMLAHFSLSTT